MYCFVLYFSGFYKVLSQLTLAGDVTAEQFISKSSLGLSDLTLYHKIDLSSLKYKIASDFIVQHLKKILIVHVIFINLFQFATNYYLV